MSSKKAIALIVILALLAGIGLGVWRLSPHPAPSAGWLFELSYPQPDGKPLHLSQARGQLTVVNFWATWCPPCVEEMPELSRIHSEMSSSDVKVIGLAVDSPSQVKNFLHDTPVSYPVTIVGAAGSEMAKKLGASVDALPYTVMIDAQGRVTHQKLGRIKEDELRKWIKEAK
jgi:peroxiredoxin